MRRIIRLQQSLDSLLPSLKPHLRSSSPSLPESSHITSKSHCQSPARLQRLSRSQHPLGHRATFHTSSRLRWSSSPPRCDANPKSVREEQSEIPSQQEAELRIEELRKRELDAPGRSSENVTAGKLGRDDTDSLIDDIAKNKDQSLLDEEDYVPASTWHGITWVGDDEFVRFQELGKAGKMKGFAPRTRITNAAQIRDALRLAVNEALVLRALGRQPADCSSDAGVSNLFAELNLALYNVVVQPAADGSDDVSLTLPEGCSLEAMAERLVTLEGDGPEEIERKLLNAEPLEEARENLARMELKEGGVVDSAAIDVRSLGEQTELDMVRVKMSRKRRQHTDSGWESVSLADMDLKFAVLKRLFQLTAVSPPDHLLHQPAATGTPGALLATLTETHRRVRARKLAQAVEDEGTLVGLPNVAFSGKKVTPLEKETKMGRWKATRAALKERALLEEESSRVLRREVIRRREEDRRRRMEKKKEEQKRRKAEERRMKGEAEGTLLAG